MKTVAKIDPEKEYENAKRIIELAAQQQLENEQVGTLGASVDNLITATRVLLERENRRRGMPSSKPKSETPKGRKKGETREEAKKLTSKKFPDLEIREEVLTTEQPPICSCCQGVMKDSGLYDVSEKIEVIPKQYFIKRLKKVKFYCPTCYGSIVTIPSPPSILPTSNDGDSLIIDVALSKYNDLLPIERYVRMAMESGVDNCLPPQSLIGLTHHLANFLEKLYQRIIPNGLEFSGSNNLKIQVRWV